MDLNHYLSIGQFLQLRRVRTLSAGAYKSSRSGLTRALVRPRSASPAPRRAPRAPTAPPAAPAGPLRHLHPYIKRFSNFTSVVVKADEEEVDDVIDLGAPRAVRTAPARAPRDPRRRRLPYTPNPRLYPGPERKPKNKVKRGGRARAPSSQRVRRCQRVFRRPVPNARLYRPAPPRPPPPPAVPNATWPPPPPPARPLDTASRAALRLSERRGWRPPPPRRPHPPALKTPSPRAAPVSRTPSPPPASRSRRLVVTLPAAGDALSAEVPLEPESPPPARYRPASEHFRLRTLSLDTESGASTPPLRPRPLRASTMDAPQRHSASPEDCSEGNSLSAPSEFLAEFLSAIMRRQYAEALKYCRLILQYEPHNATARGFYPLLQQKLAQQSPRARPATRAPNNTRSEDSGASSGSSGEEAPPVDRASLQDEVMEQEADSLESSSSAAGAGAGGGARGAGAAGRAGAGARRSASSGSVASQSSLELDSSPERSPDRSRRTDPDPDPDRTDSASASASGSGAGGWDSSGSAPSSGRDDNGNPAPVTPDPTCAWDAENNAPRSPTPPPRRAAPRPLLLKSEESAASLRRLRAQFACSIK